jgi:hypothetical protein
MLFDDASEHIKTVKVVQIKQSGIETGVVLLDSLGGNRDIVAETPEGETLRRIPVVEVEGFVADVSPLSGSECMKAALKSCGIISKLWFSGRIEIDRRTHHSRESGDGRALSWQSYP